MVTCNPALTARVYDRLGSIEAGKDADLFLVRGGGHAETAYRDLIDAREEDLELILVAESRSPATWTSVCVEASRFRARHQLGGRLRESGRCDDRGPAHRRGQRDPGPVQRWAPARLDCLGGDNPPAGGGPGPPDNTYSYLQTRVEGGNWDSPRKFDLSMRNEKHVDFFATVRRTSSGFDSLPCSRRTMTSLCICCEENSTGAGSSQTRRRHSVSIRRT